MLCEACCISMALILNLTHTDGMLYDWCWLIFMYGIVSLIEWPNINLMAVSIAAVFMIRTHFRIHSVSGNCLQSSVLDPSLTMLHLI